MEPTLSLLLLETKDENVKQTAEDYMACQWQNLD